MHKSIFSLGLLLSASPSHGQEAWSVQLDSLSHSEAVSVHGALHEMAGDFSPGDAAQTHNRLALRYAQDEWRFGLVSRYDYELRFHPDTAELIYLSHRDRELPENRQYTLDFHGRHARADGVSLGRQWRLDAPKLTISADLSLLKARALQNGDISGRLTLAAAQRPAGTARIGYRYDDDRLFHRPDDGAGPGWGYALDLGLAWQASQALTLRLQADDLLHELRWQEASYTEARLDLTASHLENGRLVVAPALTGREGEKTTKLRFQPRLAFDAEYALQERWLGTASWQSRAEQDYAWLGAAYTPAPGQHLGVAWEAEHEAVKLYWRGGLLSLGLVSDARRFEDAHILGLDLGFSLPL